jgi:hypothetical protein
MSPTEPARACRNCGALLPTEPQAAFCPACGQETALHPPTFGEFVHEFVGHYVALEGNLWRTLGALLLKPGRLTREYLDGRRRRYVLPLRLYLSASFLFFVVVKLLGANPGLNLQIQAMPDAQGHPPAVASRAKALDEVNAELKACDQSPATCTWFQRRSLQAAQATLQQGEGAIERRVVSMLPYAIFVLLPFFAALMAAVYRARGMTYGEHFVFGLHMHSFWFLALLAESLLSDLFQLPLLAAVLAYGVWALHHVYGGNWPGTMWRALLVTTVHSVALGLVAAGVLVLAAGGG